MRRASSGLSGSQLARAPAKLRRTATFEGLLKKKKSVQEICIPQWPKTYVFMKQHVF